MIDAFPDEGGPMRTGWWMLPHLLVNQAGYDTDEEIDGYFQAMRERLLVLTQLRDTRTPGNASTTSDRGSMTPKRGSTNLKHRVGSSTTLAPSDPR
jgi:hypothetical protein